jgi:Tfp pilus assembly protein PilZ
MKIFNSKLNKYNITLKKLFDAILKLNPEQQTQVMIYFEELLYENKRISPRKPCSIPINYATQNHIFSDHITDISKSGLFIETNRSLNVGEEIVLSFNMHGYDRPFKIKGNIVRSNYHGIGVEFKEVKPYIAQMLGALVERIKRIKR